MFMLSENAVQSNYVKQAKNSAKMKSKVCTPPGFSFRSGTTPSIFCIQLSMKKICYFLQQKKSGKLYFYINQNILHKKLNEDKSKEGSRERK